MPNPTDPIQVKAALQRDLDAVKTAIEEIPTAQLSLFATVRQAKDRVAELVKSAVFAASNNRPNGERCNLSNYSVGLAGDGYVGEATKLSTFVALTENTAEHAAAVAACAPLFAQRDGITARLADAESEITRVASEAADKVRAREEELRRKMEADAELSTARKALERIKQAFAA